MGYLCRQSFDGHCFRYDQYDASLDLLLRTHEFSLAVRMAMDRLRFPVQLSETARTAYLSCLEQHTEQVLELVLTEADTAPLSFLLSLDLLGRPGAGRGLRDGPHRPPHRGSGPSAGIPEPAVRRAPCPIL